MPSTCSVDEKNEAWATRALGSGVFCRFRPMPDGFSEVMLYIEEINRDTLRCSVKHVLNVRYQGIPFHASYQNHFMTVVFANGQL